MASSGWDILEAHGPTVHALILRITWRRDVADDLLHDLFVRLAGRIGRVDNPAGYMHRAAINLAMDWRLRHRREPRLPVSTEDTPGTTPDPLAVVEAAEDIGRILDAATALSELERQAFALRFIQQHSYEQIGRLLQRDAHQARGLCHAVVKHLRKELHERTVAHERSR